MDTLKISQMRIRLFRFLGTMVNIFPSIGKAALVTCVLFILKGSVCFSQTKLVGMGTLGGGSIFALDPSDLSTEKWVDFSTERYAQYGHLIESGGKLWGMTSRGGVADEGSIFHLNVDGSGFTRVHDFTGIDGSLPHGSLVESSGKFWGMTSAGGVNDFGVLFSLELSGSGFEKVYDFDESTGSNPYGSLVESGNRLWGMTYGGGENSMGVIFNLDPFSQVYSKVLDFDDANGAFPYGSLYESGGLLWGMTSQGGDNHNGVIFKLNSNLLELVKVYDFDLIEGAAPYGDLVESGNRLWGITYGGGDFGYGVVFSMSNDGTDYRSDYDFDGTSGRYPTGSLTVSGEKLWGSTPNLFSIDNDGSNFTLQHVFDFVFEGHAPHGSLTLSNGKLWGMTTYGTTTSFGSIFSVNEDGSGFSKVHAFNNDEGVDPMASLLNVDGKLWGMTAKGGAEGYGTIFTVDSDGSNFIQIHEFTSTDGAFPWNNLVRKGDKLWGVTYYGGNNHKGVIFSINTDGSGFTKIYDFNGIDGGIPYGGMVENDGKFFGSTFAGGVNNKGVIFSIEPTGSNYTKLHDFSYSSGTGVYGNLFAASERLWGLASQGGSNEYGVVFSISGDGGDYSIEHEFDGVNGGGPTGELVESNGRFWGLTRGGGEGNFGAVFSLATDGSDYIKHVDFNESTGRYPGGSLLEYHGKLWGMTYNGGANGYGTVFTLDKFDGIFVKELDFTEDMGGNPYYGSLIAVFEKQHQEISFSLADKTYGDQPFTLAATSTTENDVTYTSSNTNVIVIEGDVATLVGSGEVEITASQAENDFYFLGTKSQIITVTKAALIATADDQSRVYGSTNPALSISYQGFVNGDDVEEITEPEIATSAEITSDVASYPITLSGGAAANYELALVAGELTVTKAALKATADNQSRAYGAVNPALSISCQGFVNGDDVEDITEPDITTSAEITSDVASYPIALTGGAAANYELELVAGELTVTKAALKATADNQSRAYGAVNPALSISYQGFVNGDDVEDITEPEITTSADATSNVGNYSILLAGGVSSNYKLALFNGILSVTKAAQSITFEMSSIVAVDAMPFQLEAASDSGLPILYSSSNLSVASISGSIVTVIGVGTSTITAS